jgi:hypothetical protein
MGSRRTVLRGGRLGGAAGAEVDRGGPVEPRRAVSYWCHAGHESRPQLASDVAPPETWECVVCGQPAGVDKDEPPARVGAAGASHKTPYEFLMMRRTEAEGEKLLEEALANLHDSRSTGRRGR